MHVPHEGPGLIAEWAERRGHTLREVRLFRGDLLPDLRDLEWLVVMGGPMNVYEEDKYPWLEEETRFIRPSLAKGVRTLGICLGAQLMAKALGARVTRNLQREIGWFPVSMTREALQSSPFFRFPEIVPAFHWHGDTFAIPDGAQRVVSSSACLNQGFSLNEGRAVGLQFHWEVRPSDIDGWLALVDGMAPGPFVQAPAAMRAAATFDRTKDLLNTMLDGMAEAKAGVL
ncbi:MAG: type 1 glutamine amidotransferase [Elusimicrobia bacterium]|nr:type 1 glutamine amidotransferase [Elusimicrobiota bacterium]